MNKRKKALYLASLFSCLLFSSCGDVTTNTQLPVAAATPNGGSNSPASTRPSLVGASLEQVKQIVLDALTLCSITRTPQIVFARTATPDDVVNLGISQQKPTTDQSLAVIIGKGDFDPSKCTHDPDVYRANYIGFVFDLNAGLAISTSVSRQGGFFRKALNDPTLSDDVLPPTILPTLFVPGKSFYQFPTPNLTPQPTPAVPVTHPAGIPGIKPALSAAVPNTAAFGETEVSQYLSQAHPEWGLIKSDIPITIDKVQFIPYKDVAAQLNTDLGISSDLTLDILVCLVIRHGQFENRGQGVNPQEVTAQSPGQTAPKNYPTFSKAYWIFNAQTGNLLKMGGYGN